MLVNSGSNVAFTDVVVENVKLVTLVDVTGSYITIQNSSFS